MWSYVSVIFRMLVSFHDKIGHHQTTKPSLSHLFESRFKKRRANLVTLEGDGCLFTIANGAPLSSPDKYLGFEQTEI